MDDAMWSEDFEIKISSISGQTKMWALFHFCKICGAVVRSSSQETDNHESMHKPKGVTRDPASSIEISLDQYLDMVNAVKHSSSARDAVGYIAEILNLTLAKFP